MSINHFSSDAIWWRHTHAMDTNISSVGHNQHLHRTQLQSASSMLQTRNPCRNFNLNDDHEDRSSAVEERQAMFEKPLTPSDVGKLNRLVIPKQHAERYFPLGGGDSGDKGLILSFEDEGGKCWRFRYSYWNSSQSYVLTKGWSRYVKDKQLDAGDVVFFQRHRTDGDQFFIGWRRRNAPVQETSTAAAAGGFYPAHPYPARSPPAPLPHQPDYCTHAGTGSGTEVVPTRVPAGNLKRLRLFGVNMECQSEPSTPDGSSSQDATHYHQYYTSQVCAPNHQNHMDTSYSSGGVKQQSRRGRG